MGDRLFAFSDCIDYRPCPLLERNLSSGAVREVHPAVYDAWLTSVGGRPWLVATDWDGEHERINIIDPDSADRRLLAVPVLLAGLSPVRNNDYGAVGLPPGWLALAPGGEVPRPARGGRMFAINLDTSRLLMLLGGNS